MFNKVVVNWQTIVKLNFKFCINKNPTGLPVGMSRPRNHNLYNHRTAHCQGCLHRLQTFREADDSNGIGQTCDSLETENETI